MQVFFGLELDDLVYPLNKRDACCSGQVYWGTQKLLTNFEIYLGLSGYAVNDEYLRVEQYRQALLKHIEQYPSSFYTTSFWADQFATATELLHRRDELLLAKWDFTIKEDTPHRLQTISTIEAYFHHEDPEQRVLLSPGYSDRFVAVEKALTTQSLPITEIIHREPFDLLPLHLQRLFEQLQKKGVKVIQLEEEKTYNNNNLSFFKKNVLAEDGQISKYTLQENDNSIIILKAKRETEAAAYLAKLMRNNQDFQPVYVIPEKNRALDNALIQEGLPSMGILSESLARPVLQILKLVTVFLWNPIDPYKIMQFVSLAVKPLEDDLANTIAQLMARSPGINGDAWYARIRSYFANLEAQSKTDKTIRVADIKREYEFWFERQRYDISKTVPKTEAQGLFEYLSNWAYEQFDNSGSRNTSLLVLSEQARRIDELLETLPEHQLTNLELERIVRTIYEPSPVLFKEKELGHAPYIHNPSAMTKEADTVVWWNFIQNEPNYFFSKWYPQERSYLATQNCYLQTPQDQNQRLVWQRKQPIIQAKQQLILVVPDYTEGQAAFPHALYGDLEATFSDLSAITFDVSYPERQEQLAAFFELPTWVTLPHRPLGQPKPFLEIPNLENFIESEYETFTSLESLFYYPYQWVFKHKIKLIKSSILSVVKDNVLMGNLSHRVFERLFQEEGIQQWQQDKVYDWVEKESSRLLPREGAVFLMYGREPERINFVNKMKYAAWSLVSLIQKNKWGVEGTEVALFGDFKGVNVKGVADLVLKRGEEELAVVDLKWGGLTRRKSTIKNEEDLQLVLYSKLLDDPEKWTHTAYFVMEKGNMIARNHLGFEQITAVSPEQNHEEINDRILRKMEATYQWRMEQIRNGKIEIRCEQTKIDLEDAYIGKLLDKLELPDKNAPFDDYETLINLID